jgi:hypothetical protein
MQAGSHLIRYGPHLPEGAPEDGVERGIGAFVICATLIRQYEFAQNVWVNDRNFTNWATNYPIIGNHDGTFEFKTPKRPIPLLAFHARKNGSCQMSKSASTLCRTIIAEPIVLRLSKVDANKDAGATSAPAFRGC